MFILSRDFFKTVLNLQYNRIYHTTYNGCTWLTKSLMLSVYCFLN